MPPRLCGRGNGGHSMRQARPLGAMQVEGSSHPTREGQYQPGAGQGERDMRNTDNGSILVVILGMYLYVLTRNHII